LAASLVVAAATFSPLGRRNVPLPSGFRLVARAIEGSLRSSQVTESPRLRAAYAQAFRIAGPDHTIAAVDRPYLIDYRRFDIPHLDAPGFMTADGRGFPFFTGPADKMRRLRRAGYDTLVASTPDDDACLKPARVERARERRVGDREIYDRFLDWTADVRAIEERVPEAVRSIGPLLVIDLERAERGLQADR
jgi:hypothetical protein